MHPEDWFKPLFDKMQRILDAAGGPQDLLSNFSLITITKCESILDAAGGPQDLLSDFSLIAITKRKAFWTRSKATQPVGALPQSGKDQSRPNYALYKITNPQPPLGVFYWPTQSIGSSPCSTKRKAFWTPQAVRRTCYQTSV